MRGTIAKYALLAGKYCVGGILVLLGAAAFVLVIVATNIGGTSHPSETLVPWQMIVALMVATVAAIISLLGLSWLFPLKPPSE